MTKYDLITREWNKLTPTLNEEFDVDGWINFDELSDDFDLSNVEFKNNSKDKRHSVYVRPKTLKGIEDNNGWTKLETKEDLPENTGQYLTLRKRGIIITEWFYKNDVSWHLWKSCYNITHYKKILEHNKPLF